MKRTDEKSRIGDRDREDRGGGRDDRGAGGAGGEKRSFHKRKGCRFCADTAVMIDHKDRFLLAPFLTERFKIVPRRISGTCAFHQRRLTLAIKRARHVAIIPYTTAQN